MRYVVAAIAGLVVVAYVFGLTALCLVLDKPGPSATSCTQIIHHYLHTTASAAGVTLTHEHLIACHHDGDEATVRVEFDVDIPGKPRQHEVLAVRLVKSAWWAADAHVVG